jgi:hypothetical protein
MVVRWLVALVLGVCVVGCRPAASPLPPTPARKTNGRPLRRVPIRFGSDPGGHPWRCRGRRGEVNPATLNALAGNFGIKIVADGVDTVIARGETTGGCVRASVVDGATFRFSMGVVEECTFDRTEVSRYINLFDMHQKYADVVSLLEAVEYFDSVGAASRMPALAR